MPEEDWRVGSAGFGTKGERLYAWALVELFRWGTHRRLVRRILEDPWGEGL